MKVDKTHDPNALLLDVAALFAIDIIVREYHEKAHTAPPYYNPALDKRLRQSMRKTKRRKGTLTQRVAGVAAAVLVLCTAGISAYAHWDYIYYYLFGTTTHSVYGGEVTQLELRDAGFRSIPCYLPRGYTAISYYQSGDYGQISYVNVNRDVIFFEEYSEEIHISMDEETLKKCISVGGIEGHMIYGKGFALIWPQNGRYYYLGCSDSNFSEKDLIRIAESVKAVAG